MFENMVERAIILEKSGVITPESLPQSMSVFQIETLDLSEVWTIEELKKDYAERVVELYGGNRSKTAEVLGVFLTSLWRILRRKCNPIESDDGHR